MKCCFIGHRKLEVTDELISRLKQEIEKLILSGVTHFLFGTRSEFNSLCHKVVSDLKQSYPQILRIAYTTFHECVVLQKEVERYESIMSQLWHREVHLQGYEEEITPTVLRKSGKASYLERNRIMIDDSDYCVFYYDEKYRPDRRELSRKYLNNVLSSAQSGTASAFRYATRKKKTIINVFSLN
ncbi:MAG: DUF1273 family protein [Clostridia bacterium]|nr:DUF1273 family protein [Clostridia bacterium]